MYTVDDDDTDDDNNSNNNMLKIVHYSNLHFFNGIKDNF